MENKNLNALFDQIAEQHLSIETLRERKSDSLDFHEVSVWGLRAALQAAYEAGAKVKARRLRNWQ